MKVVWSVWFTWNSGGCGVLLCGAGKAGAAKICVKQRGSACLFFNFLISVQLCCFWSYREERRRGKATQYLLIQRLRFKLKHLCQHLFLKLWSAFKSYRTKSLIIMFFEIIYGKETPEVTEMYESVIDVLICLRRIIVFKGSNAQSSQKNHTSSLGCSRII